MEGGVHTAGDRRQQETERTGASALSSEARGSAAEGTDAGGTGLNLQVADTVVNLELPWNPAVLEQRIARVHRMGQSRPVRVINLVTRGTIEEKVLRTIEAKQGLFAGVNISGGVLQVDEDDNRELYGKAVTARQILHGDVTTPSAATPFMGALKRG